MKIKLVPCDDGPRDGSWNPPKRLMVDGVHRGWVAYKRTSGFRGSDGAGHYVFSLLPSQWTARGSKADPRWQWKVGRLYSWPGGDGLDRHVSTWLKDGYLPSADEVPAKLAEQDGALKTFERKERRRNLRWLTWSKRREASAARIEAEATAEREADRAQQSETVSALQEIADTFGAALTNYQRAGLMDAIRRLKP